MVVALQPSLSVSQFAENLKSLKPISEVREIIVYDGSNEVTRIPNQDGKRGSVQVYANLLGFEDGMLSQADVEKGLGIFAEHTEYEIAHSDERKHPNIRVLLDAKVAQTQQLRGVINFAIPGDLESRVRELNEVKKAGKLAEKKTEALQAFNEVANLLEKGHLRTAQYSPQGWKVNDWVKQAIMFSFPLGQNINYGNGFVDKDTLPLRNIDPSLGIRTVPPASGLRRGSYAGTGYANIGSFIGRGTMVENLVGSCAQVGKNCHISAGAVIGGVLDPIEATPVILGDYVLMGEGSGVTQGTRLGDLVTLAPGVHISKGTPIIDPIRERAYTSEGVFGLELLGNVETRSYRIGNQLTEKSNKYGPEVPRGALLVPGVFYSSKGNPRIAPTVAKYIENTEQRAYNLNEDLR
jgi:2,3,4,5-tetrahydropyridine-2,6-dicarboxylate N-succinyltransferase